MTDEFELQIISQHWLGEPNGASIDDKFAHASILSGTHRSSASVLGISVTLGAERGVTSEVPPRVQRRCRRRAVREGTTAAYAGERAQGSGLPG